MTSEEYQRQFEDPAFAARALEHIQGAYTREGGMVAFPLHFPGI